MNSMKCLRMKDMINDYLDLDDVLSQEDKREMFAHVETCEGCRAYFEDMKAISDVMAEDMLEDLPEGFEEQLHMKLKQAAEEIDQTTVVAFKAPTKKTAKKRFDMTAFRRYAPAMSAAAVVVLAVGITMSGMDQFKGAPTYDMATGPVGAPQAPESAVSQPVAPEAATMMADGAAGTESAKFGASPTMMKSKSAPEGTRSAEPTFTDVTAEQGRKIIQSGALTMESTKMDEAIKKLEAVIKENGGFIENASVGNAPPIYEPSGEVKAGSDKLRTAWYHVRIPADHFDGILDKVAAIGKETNRSVSSQDITAQYVDTESQVKNLQAREISLRNLMGKTGNVKDLLEVDRELTTVRTQIDSLMSQKKSWDGQITLSSVDININEVMSYTGDIAKTKEGLGGMLRNALVDSANALIKVVSKTFYMVVLVLPYAILFGLVYLGVTKISGFKKQK